ncbi:MAG: hypothetical protein ACI4VS_01080 [Candidatus Nanosyncoccaceae bacterium]
MVNRENLNSSDGENPTSEWDTLTEAQKRAAENESGSAEAQPEKSEPSQAENHEDGEEKEKIAEKIKVINLYGLGEVVRAIRAAGGDMYKFMSSEALILEHKDGESEEDAAKITFDELIEQLKQDCGDRTVESTGADNNGETTDGSTTEESGEDKDSDEDEEGNSAGVVAAAAGAGAVAAGAAAAHNNGESVNNGTTDAERNVEQAEKRKGLLDRLKKKGAWKKAVVLGLVLTTLLGVGGGIKRNAEGPKKQDTAAVETYDDVEQENNFEILSMDESYRGRFANENNDGYNEKKEGKLSFSISFEDYCKELGDEALGKSDGELRKEYIKVVAMQPESLSSYIYYAHSIVDRVPALHDTEVAQGRRLNMQEINTVIESDEAVRDQALKEFWEWIDEAEVSKVSVTGPQWNVYMRNTKGEGQAFDHDDIELVTCHTYENGSSASLFGNKQRNEQVEARDNCGYQALGQEKQEGVKEVDEDGNDVDPGPGDTDPDPDPGSGDPDPGNPDPGPGDPDPGNPDPGDPDPGTPTEELDEKNPEDEDIDMPGDHKWVDEDKGPETGRQDIPDGYNPDQGNFTKPDETPGTSQGDVNPAGNIQEGAVDTSTTESADGSGQTIKEVVDNADTSTVTDTGKKVSDQTNGGTVQEQIHSETQVKEQEAAVQAQQQAEQERQEVNQQYGGEDGKINTQEENANAFNAGEY